MAARLFLGGALVAGLLALGGCASAAPEERAGEPAAAPTSLQGAAAGVPSPAQAETAASGPSTASGTASAPAMRVAAVPEPFLFADAGRVIVAGADGVPERALAAGLVAASAVWSPDRSQVAYVALYPPEARGTYVTRADGSAAPLRVAPYGVVDNPPVWSPDGLQLALRERAGANQGIWVVNADGTGLTRLFDKNISDLAWSPDGWTIAFSYNERPSSGGVYTVSAYGGTPRLVAPLLRAGSVAWSPDGRGITARSLAADGMRVVPKVRGTGQLSVVEIATGRTTQAATGLAAGAWRPVWANPYSIAVILEGEGGQALAVVSRTGEALSVLARAPSFSGLAWSRDAATLLSAVATPEGTYPLRVALQDVGMDWTMDMDMTRNMKPDQVLLLRDGALRPWDPAAAPSAPAPAPAATAAPPSGIRMARLAFDKYT